MSEDPRVIRWGVAGPGGIAAQFADAMSFVDGGVITAVASRSQERADAYGDRFAVPGRYGSYEALAEDPDIDAVYVATPHSRHEADALLYLEAGKHVLCEKPFALNADQARRMTAAARAKGLFLMEAIWTRFLPSYRALVDVLGEGRIGDPQLVEADFGFRMPVMPEHRLFDLAQGGGALLDLGIYPVQLCSLVLGPPDGIAATGHVGEIHHPGGALGVVKAAIRINTTCRARIAGTDGAIELPAFMHCPDHLLVNGERIDGSFEGDGLRFQVDEVHRCLAAGLTESPVVPLAESIRLATTLDEIRATLGVVYPGEGASSVTSRST
jgi:predicted dehydrogenase